MSNRSTSHRFTQDLKEEFGAAVCGECGMWPDHHNHAVGRHGCVCVECIPDDRDLPDEGYLPVQMRTDRDFSPWAPGGEFPAHP